MSIRGCEASRRSHGGEGWEEGASCSCRREGAWQHGADGGAAGAGREERGARAREAVGADRRKGAAARAADHRESARVRVVASGRPKPSCRDSERPWLWSAWVMRLLQWHARRQEGARGLRATVMCPPSSPRSPPLPRHADFTLPGPPSSGRQPPPAASASGRPHSGQSPSSRACSPPRRPRSRWPLASPSTARSCCCPSPG